MTAVVCDRCGLPISTLAGAVVRVVFNEADLATAVAVVHSTCRAGEPAARVEDEPAVSFAETGSTRAAWLRDLARAPDVSASRALRKVARLAAAVRAA